MPTATFFRLPEEKRTRLIESAWEEFTTIPFAEASINRIIRSARIPRGSFYQYFADKTDLFLYLMDQSRSRFIALFARELELADGDIFGMIAGVFDALFQPDGTVTPAFLRVFELFRLNASIDVPRLFFERPKEELAPLDLLAERVDTSRLKSGEKEYIDSVFTLLISSMGCAVARTLQDPTLYAQERKHLHEHIEIIKNGSAAVEKGEHQE